MRISVMHVRRHVPAAIYHLEARAVRPWSHEFAAAASLHAHTWYSREPVAFIDFSQAFFRPPLDPRSVHRAEVEQIARTLDVSALGSITDHDSIKSGQVMRSSGVEPSAPISLKCRREPAGATTT